MVATENPPNRSATVYRHAGEEILHLCPSPCGDGIGYGSNAIPLVAVPVRIREWPRARVGRDDTASLRETIRATKLGTYEVVKEKAQRCR